MPDNSDMKFDFLVSFEALYQAESPFFANYIKTDWTFNPCETWILLKPGRQPQNIQQSLVQHLLQNGNARNRIMNTVALQPLKDIHLHASTVINNASTSDIVYVYVFVGIAFLILLIANVNFINLSVARSINRIKEVGVRVKSQRGKKQLVQF